MCSVLAYFARIQKMPKQKQNCKDHGSYQCQVIEIILTMLMTLTSAIKDYLTHMLCHNDLDL